MNLSPESLLTAYAQGIFPMAEEGEILWFSPTMRGVIPLDERFHVPKSLKKTLKKKPFEIRMNTSFEAVMRGCAERENTWIDDEIIASYVKLYDMGFAHSVECWDEGGLQGGLYGVALGAAFFGESMFSRKTDASKVALVFLVEWLRENDYQLLDTQWMTDHLKKFGGEEVPKVIYLNLLQDALADLYL